MNHFLIDTHAHLYLPEFEVDREYMIQRAVHRGIRKILMPNIDSSSVRPMNDLAARYPGICYQMMGLHPTSVKEDYADELAVVKMELENGTYYAIGETGIDLHWDTQHVNQQCVAFEEQIKLALKYRLPVVIHARKSFNEIFEILEGYKNNSLTGIFHAFTGDMVLAERVLDMGFLLGIGGIVTFKKSGLDTVVQNTDLKYIVLETDSPYLAPVPMRGKRNESSYLYHIAESVGQIKGLHIDEVAQITAQNSLSVFNKVPDNDGNE